MLFPNLLQEVARIQNLENQPVALISILAGKGRKVLHSRRFQRLIAEEFKLAADGFKDVSAAGRFEWTKVAGAFR